MKLCTPFPTSHITSQRSVFERAWNHESNKTFMPLTALRKRFSVAFLLMRIGYMYRFSSSFSLYTRHTRVQMRLYTITISRHAHPYMYCIYMMKADTRGLYKHVPYRLSEWNDTCYIIPKGPRKEERRRESGTRSYWRLA